MSLACRSNDVDMIRFVEALEEELAEGSVETPAADYEDVRLSSSGSKQLPGRNVHRIQNWEEIMSQNLSNIPMSGSAHRLKSKVRSFNALT